MRVSLGPNGVSLGVSVRPRVAVITSASGAVVVVPYTTGAIGAVRGAATWILSIRGCICKVIYTRMNMEAVRCGAANNIPETHRVAGGLGDDLRRYTDIR